MKNSILIKILKTFTLTDISDFRKFLQSPYHTETKLLLEFFDYLRRFHPEYSSHRLKKEHLCQLFFAEKNYTESQAAKRLRNMASQLKQLMEDYFALREYKKDKHLQKRLLIKAYQESGNYDFFKGKLDDAFMEVEKEIYKDDDYFLKKLMLYQLEYQHPQTNQKEKNGESITSLMGNLDEYFILQKLKGGMDLVTRKKYRSGEYAIEFLADILQYIKDKNENDNPRFHLYPLIIDLFQHPLMEEKYFQLKNMFFLYKEALTLQEQKNVYTCLSNYFSALVRENNHIDKYEIWKLQKIGLKEKFLFENHQIPVIKFENIVVVSTFLKEFAWTKNFIENYSEFLDSEQKNNVVALCWTYYYFFQNEFEKVITLLQEIEFTDYSYKSRTRSLLLRSYYELIAENDNYYESFLSLSQSFEKFLRRDKNRADDYQKGYINFIVLIRLLAKIKITPDKNKDYKEIVEKIASTKYLVARPWFEEKIANFL